MRRFFAWAAAIGLLAGTADFVLSDGNRPLLDTVATAQSALSPARAHAAPPPRPSRDEVAAYYQTDPVLLEPVAQTSATSPTTSSRRTQLDSRFEDASLSLSEDEPAGFRDAMGPPPEIAHQPSLARELRPSDSLPAARQPLTTSPHVPTNGPSAVSAEAAPVATPESAALAPHAIEIAAPPTIATAPPAVFEPTPTVAALPERAPGQVASPIAMEAPVTTVHEGAAPYPQHLGVSTSAPAAFTPAESPASPIQPDVQPDAAAATSAAANPWLEPPVASTEQNPEASTPMEASHAGEAEELSPPAAAPQDLFAIEHEPAARPSSPDTAGDSPTSTAPDVHAFVPVPAETTAVVRENQDAVSLEWLTPDEVNRGDQINCRLQVTNGGATPAFAVEVHVQLPEQVELIAASAEPAPQGSLLTWQIEQLAPQESKTFELQLRTHGEGDLSPSATVTFSRAAQANIHVLDPQLALSIEGPDQALVSQPAVYHVRVTNPGTGRAKNVVVQAQLDERLAHPEGARLQYTIGTLGPGESRLLEVPVTGTSPGPANIVAQATSAERLTAQGGHVLEVVRPELQLTIDGPKLRFLDRKAVFVITAHNPSAVAATNVQVFGSVPAGFRYEQATSGGAYDDALGAVAWFVGRLEPQQSVRVEYELVAEELGQHRVAAAVRADLGVEERTEMDIEVDGVTSVALEVTGYDDPIEVGGETTYRLAATNRGTKAAHRVQIACRVPAEMEAIDARGATLPSVSGDRVLFEPIAELAPGESREFSITVRCRQAGDVRFRAYFRSDECQEVVQQEALTRIYQD